MCTIDGITIGLINLNTKKFFTILFQTHDWFVIPLSPFTEWVDECNSSEFNRVVCFIIYWQTVSVHCLKEVEWSWVVYSQLSNFAFSHFSSFTLFDNCLLYSLEQEINDFAMTPFDCHRFLCEENKPFRLIFFHSSSEWGKRINDRPQLKLAFSCSKMVNRKEETSLKWAWNSLTSMSMRLTKKKISIS